MKAGDLRRFKDSAVFPAAASETFPCRTFLVLNIFDRVPGKFSGRVEVLLDGKVLGPWGYAWVEQSSELLEPV
jgi:hypothetical protein